MSEPLGPKTRYKTSNWAAYNAALKARGSLTIWLDKDMQWYAPASDKRGRQQTFTDAAIQFCLSIKCLFGLALRQSLGLIHSLLRLADLDWRVPDFSTISRRQKTLQVQLSVTLAPRVTLPSAAAKRHCRCNCPTGAALRRWICWWTARHQVPG